MLSILDVDLADEVAIAAIAELRHDAERQVLGETGQGPFQVADGLLQTRHLAMRRGAKEEVVEIYVEERAPRVLDLLVVAAGPDQPVLMGLAADLRRPQELDQIVGVAELAGAEENAFEPATPAVHLVDGVAKERARQAGAIRRLDLAEVAMRGNVQVLD